MPGRKYQATTNSQYRYSINGQEKESELNENITTAEFWEYDSRIGRRWNIDPVTKEFESPYATFSNNPIYYTDTKGADSDPPGGDKPQYKKPGFLKRLWRGLGGAHHINRAETYAAEVQKCASDVQLVNVDKDTKVVIAKFYYNEGITFDADGNPVATVRVSTKYSIFREDRNNGRIISIPGSQDDDVNLTKQEFIDKYSVSNTTMPAPGFGGSGGAGAIQLAAQGSKASVAAQAINLSLQDSKIAVYLSKGLENVIQYAGITNNLAIRAAAHMRQLGIKIEPLLLVSTRKEARAVEQALIEIHGLGKNGGTLLNKINSISKTNTEYANQLQRGYELLKSIGY